MANPAPLGVFDSGIGGISILKEIRTHLPEEDLIYLADSSHCPYGTKTVAAIRERSLAVTDFLVGLGAKLIVVACNSASVAGLDQIRDKYPYLPVVGVEPAIKPAQQLTQNGKIGVLATHLTISGSRFTILVEKYGTGVEVYTQPAPGLVELVEAGQMDEPETYRMLHQYLDPLLAKGIDTLVLGCTHYPFLKPVIQKIGGPELAIVDTGLAVARQIARVIAQRDLQSDRVGQGGTAFYTSGDPDRVRRVIEKLMSQPGIEVKEAGF